jgi:hypothetical protein
MGVPETGKSLDHTTAPVAEYLMTRDFVDVLVTVALAAT